MSEANSLECCALRSPHSTQTIAFESLAKFRAAQSAALQGASLKPQALPHVTKAKMCIKVCSNESAGVLGHQYKGCSHNSPTLSFESVILIFAINSQSIS